MAQGIPAGAFRCKGNVPVQYIDMLVLRKMDKVAYRLAEELEDLGDPSFVTAAQETDWKELQARELRPAVDAASASKPASARRPRATSTPESAARLSPPAFSPSLSSKPTGPTEQVCIGESCSRGLHSCPADAGAAFGIKRACATEAQEFGFSILQFFERFIMRRSRKRRWRSRGLRFLAGIAAGRRFVRRLSALSWSAP